MSELEERQDLLLKKLDILYEKIKTISSYCKLSNISHDSSALSMEETKANKNTEVSSGLVCNYNKEITSGL